MEVTPETCVLFSTLQLCDSQATGGLFKIRAAQINTELATIFNILKSGVDEITHGLEFDFTKQETDHCKFKMATVLTALAMRDSFVDDLDLESDLYMMLGDFPAISLDLLYTLITSCDMETAFIRVVESLHLTLQLKLISHAIDFITENNRIDSLCLLSVIIEFIFVHSNGLLPKLTSCEHAEKRSEGYQVVDKLLMYMNNFVRNLADSQDALMPQTFMVFLVALLNLVGVAHLLPMFSYNTIELRLECEASNAFMTSQTNTFKTSQSKMTRDDDDVTNTVQFQIFRDKYHVSVSEYQTVMQFIFAHDVAKYIHECRLAAQSIPVETSRHGIDLLQYLLYDDHVTDEIVREMSFSLDSQNVQEASTWRWVSSCYAIALFRKHCENIEHMHTMPTVKAFLKSKGKTEHMRIVQNKLLNPCWQRVSQLSLVTEDERFVREMVLIGEKLDQWEASLQWMLCETSLVSDPRWILTLKNNTDNLMTSENLRLLWLRVSSFQSDQRQNEVFKTLAKLFLEVFEQHPIQNQNKMLHDVFNSGLDMKALFGADSTRTFAQLTVLLNRIVQVERCVSDTVMRQIAPLALKCPHTVVTYLVKHATQNTQQCDVILQVLRHLNALVSYREADSKTSVLIGYLVQSVRNIAVINEKERKHVLRFILKCTLHTGGKNSEERIPSELNSSAQELQITEKLDQKPLVHFIDILKHVIFPLLCELTKDCSQDKVFTDDTFLFLIDVLSAILENHQLTRCDEKQSRELSACAILLSLIEYVVYIEEHTSVQSVAMLSPVKDNLASTIRHVQGAMTTNASLVPHCDVTWLSSKLAALPWKYTGYVLPFNRSIQKLVHPSATNFHALDFKVPQALTKLLSNNASLLSILFSNFESDHANEWSDVLHLATISDELCEFACDAMNENVIVSSHHYLQFMSALLEFLPFASNYEWIRCAKLINIACHKSVAYFDTRHNSSRDSEIPQDSVTIVFDILLAILDSMSDNAGFETHIVKSSTHALRFLLNTQRSQSTSASKLSKTDSEWSKNQSENKTQNAHADVDLENDMEAKIDKQITYFTYMTQILSRLSEMSRDQVISLVLETVEKFAQLVKQMTVEKGKVYVSHLQVLIQNANCETFRDLVCKKLHERGLLS